MSDMNDCGRSSFASWARGCAHKARWLGQFDPSMTAAEAWKRLDFDGKLSSFASFERGWNSAQADVHMPQELIDAASAAVTKATGQEGAA